MKKLFTLRLSLALFLLTLLIYNMLHDEVKYCSVSDCQSEKHLRVLAINQRIAEDAIVSMFESDLHVIFNFTYFCYNGQICDSV